MTCDGPMVQSLSFRERLGAWSSVSTRLRTVPGMPGRSTIDDGGVEFAAQTSFPASGILI
jgi:hypothetical protein